jgi:putative aminopeptidase FrvX
MKSAASYLLCAVCLFSGASSVLAQSAKGPVPGTMAEDLKVFVETPAIPGYEGALAAVIRRELRAFSPQDDNLGDVLVTVGSGAPHRLLAAPLDEPGYVVSEVKSDGYLRLQRLPQFGILPLYNELYSAQPVQVETASGQWLNGVVAGLSVHLMPGRTHPPDPNSIASMDVDVGAQNASQARQAGADVLSPVVIRRKLYTLGYGKLTSPAIGDRFGDAALVEVLRHLDASRLHGTLTVAFVTQQWTGARGLERVLDVVKPDELIDVGRLIPGGSPFAPASEWRFPQSQPGNGVLVGVPDNGTALTGLAAELKQLAGRNHIPLAADFSAPLMPRSYLPSPPLPPRSVHLAIATAWPSTPAEMIDAHDLGNLAILLEDYLQGRAARPVFPPARMLPEPPLPEPPRRAPSPKEMVRDLVGIYGVSGHEAAVREAIERLLPAWAKTTTDSSGNLVLQVASAPAGAKAPSILVVAHMDEIGYEVKSILPDGRLAVRSRGGGLPYFFAGHATLVHTTQGIRPGVIELPAGWREPGFQWPRGREALYRVDVGTRSAAEASLLGVQAGDFVTIPKRYRPLLGTRANARSFDDRLGCAALIAAVWTLGPNLRDRNVTFIWSTGEELGLVGAAAAAKRLAVADRTPDVVFAVDTFVSSDSPLESKRFADAKIGKGFVVRAVDNSNIIPWTLVEKTLRLAKASQIPTQFGVTGGGNDGSSFLRFGATDVALGWPLRYSHSPGEVVDTRDLDALARMVEAISRSW